MVAIHLKILEPTLFLIEDRAGWVYSQTTMRHLKQFVFVSSPRRRIVLQSVLQSVLQYFTTLCKLTECCF